jgi:hypothetical protein
LINTVKTAAENFDFKSECQAKTTGNTGGKGKEKGEIQCCGEYPGTFPFYDQFGTKACCGNLTYNTKHNCCSNENTVLSIGSC